MSNTTSSGGSSQPSRRTGTQPDIVFILADDLGYADLGCYGGRQADFGAVSPHLDALAAQGMRFTRGYANSPVCSPTRFALMTGRWQYRLRGAAEVPAQIGSRLFHLDGGSIHTYRRMIHHMDEGIGHVVRALRDAGRLDNALIVFTSDNGGERFSDNWPLVGGKMDLTEGGIRVPWIAHWPARVPAGKVSDQHCLTMDWTATLIDAAGASPAADYPLDGVSLLGVLTQVQPAFARRMHWRMNHRGQRALRDGRWKYLTVDGNEYLFDVEADERERANLAAREPDRLASQRQAWHAWNETLPPTPDDATVSLGYSVADMPQR
ncbi:MAG: sulfatase-like hydrolase/transferase [Rubrivivax sp.]|nr:sulfatase-like hydrolase/transferase [Rubrivivax sp.]